MPSFDHNQGDMRICDSPFGKEVCIQKSCGSPLEYEDFFICGSPSKSKSYLSCFSVF